MRGKFEQLLVGPREKVDMRRGVNLDIVLLVAMMKFCSSGVRSDKWFALLPNVMFLYYCEAACVFTACEGELHETVNDLDLNI